MCLMLFSNTLVPSSRNSFAPRETTQVATVLACRHGQFSFHIVTGTMKVTKIIMDDAYEALGHQV